LKRIEKIARKLRDAIKALDGEALRTMIRYDLADISPVERGRSYIRNRDWLSEQIGAVERLETWAAAASKRVSRKETRDSGNLHWLVQRLDCILFEHTKRRVSRSIKSNKDGPRRFVKNVVALVYPDAGQGFIAEAIKAATKKPTALMPPMGRD
jgi:hypothetical protein